MAEKNNNKKPNILIIEDEKMITEALVAKLDASGFVTSTAFDGKEGLEKALSEKPDLILLDIVMPEMDGITLLDQLREDDWGKEVPVIILTNLSKGETSEEIQEKGVTSYLVKTDWSLDEVVKKIKYELGII